ncbi:piggyBac transposable element-derived protein 3-like [Lineus longissimus]|uniref:piggyBac transposable element-derived protein 3-like n=1 Tax=Lineus longissimus TaxID=88925 RepID=UPI00315C7A0C
MNRPGRMSVQDVLDAIDGEDSEFEGCESEDSDDDDQDYTNDADDGDDDISSQSSGSDDFSDEDDIPLATLAARATTSKKKKQGQGNKATQSWIDKDFDPPDTTFLGKEIEYPADTDIPSPYYYFKKFITDEMLELCVEQTNMYSVEKGGKSANLTKKELEQVLGMVLRMGLMQMSGNRAYWEQDSRYPAVADIMGRNRFSYLLTVLHFVDNNAVTDDQKKDKIWKIRPWIDEFRDHCRTVVPEEHNSIDEQMIPFKGKRSPIKQYVKGRPHSTETGILCHFDVYQGGDGKKTELGMGGDVVTKLCETLPKHQNYKVFADNFFTSVKLAAKLLESGILYVGTVRKNRLGVCPFTSDKLMERKGRGTMESFVENNSNVVAVKWYDNKAVTLLSTYAGEQPSDKCK